MSLLPYHLGNPTDSRNTVQVGTGWGSEVDILAPAQHIWMADKATDGFMQWSGGSWAVPLTAGVIACMLQGHARLTTRAEVQALNTKLIANATTGLLRPAYGYTLPDKVLYLDPEATFETF